jgi:hypothetical protein
MYYFKTGIRRIWLLYQRLRSHIKLVTCELLDYVVCRCVPLDTRTAPFVVAQYTTQPAMV